MATELKKIENLDAVLAGRENGTVLIFKHSPTCGVSAFAFKEVSQFLEKSEQDVHMVIVRERRDISLAIADQLGIRHESPQFLIISKDTVEVLNHYDITADGIIAKLG